MTLKEVIRRVFELCARCSLVKKEGNVGYRLEEAIRRVFELMAQLPHITEEGNYGFRLGRIFIDTGSICRGMATCPHCGRSVGMGVITVRHDDGRSVSFNPRLVHYVEAGHPITSDDIDGETLIAILTDV